MEILFVSFRETDNLTARERDRAGLLATGCLRPDQIRIVHVADGPLPPLDGVVGVILGGSKWQVFADYPRKAETEAFVLEACHRGLPVFGICFGHQLLAKVLGGQVALDEARQEMGTVETTLLPAAIDCPLFQGLPVTFPVQCSHYASVIESPPTAIILAKSAACPIHAFTMPGTIIYAVQFHPERSKAQFDAMMSDHGISPEARAALRETPEAASLVAHFVALATNS